MAEFSLLSVAFYAYFGAGSVAIGYLLLRLSYPEVRLMDFNQRLGISALSGLLLAAAAFAVDYSFDAADVMQRQGFFPLVLFLLLLASFIVVKVYFALSQSAFLTIGIPMTTPIAVAPPAVHMPPALPLPPPQAKPLTAPVQPLAPISLDFSRLDKAGPAAKPPAPQQPLKPAAQPPREAPTPPAKPSQQPTLPPAIARPLPSPLVPAKPIEAPPAKPLQPPAPASVAGVQAVPQAKDKKSVILRLRKEEAYAEPKPSLFERLFGFLSPKPSEKKAELPKTLLKQQPVKPLWRQKTGEAEVKPPDKLPPPTQKPVSAPVAEKRGYLAGITGIVEEEKRKKAEVEPTPEPELPKPEVLTLKPEAPPEAGERAITTYRGRLKVGGQPPQKPASPEDLEAEEIAAELAPKLKPPPAQRQMVHRRYMVSQEGGEEKDVGVIADKSVAERQEFDGLVADVYSQLKENEKPAGLKSALAVNAPPKPPQQKPAGKDEKPVLTFDDLVKGEKPAGVPAEKPAASEVFAKLRSITGETAMQSNIEFVKVEAGKTAGCPTCHSKNSKIIFCPYCGAGMCANCSPKIKPFSDSIVYTCPKCQEEVTVKKRV